MFSIVTLFSNDNKLSIVVLTITYARIGQVIQILYLLIYRFMSSNFKIINTSEIKNIIRLMVSGMDPETWIGGGAKVMIFRQL